MEKVQATELEERCCIKPCNKSCKVGVVASFAALVVVGNKAGDVGFGSGKDAWKFLRQWVKQAFCKEISRNLFPKTTAKIPHEVSVNRSCKSNHEACSARNWRYRWWCVRAVLESVGVKDILPNGRKSQSTQAVRALSTVNQLKQLKNS